jgi:hypothetical protein
MAKKSQSSFEFTLIIVAFIFIFSLFLIFFNDRLEVITNDKNYKQLEMVGKIMESEVKLASFVQEGYNREFDLPGTIDGKEYIIEFESSDDLHSDYSVFVTRYEDTDVSANQYVFFGPKNMKADINIDTSTAIVITKGNGMVCINTPGCATP